MATEEKNVPLWLDIKTEYIDENFEKVLEYLKSEYDITLEIKSQKTK